MVWDRSCYLLSTGFNPHPGLLSHRTVLCQYHPLPQLYTGNENHGRKIGTPCGAFWAWCRILIHIRLLFAYTLGRSRYDRPSHRVYMTFFSRRGWQVQFVEADLKTPLPRTFTFAHADKIRELACRGEALGTLEAKQTLEEAIEKGRGGTYLRLTGEQYAKLKRKW